MVCIVYASTGIKPRLIQIFICFYMNTRSLGALRAPTSSWRPFGPLYFVLRALRALRPCDPRKFDQQRHLLVHLYVSVIHVSLMHVSVMDVSVMDVYVMHVSVMDVYVMHVSVKHVSVMRVSMMQESTKHVSMMHVSTMHVSTMHVSTMHV